MIEWVFPVLAAWAVIWLIIVFVKSAKVRADRIEAKNLDARKLQATLAERGHQFQTIVPYRCEYPFHPPHKHKRECGAQLEAERLIKEWSPPRSL